MSWEHWINNNDLKFINCDDMLDFLVAEFKLNRKSRKQDFVDMKQFVALWAVRHKLEFKKYRSNARLAKKIGLDCHSSITHLTSYRTPTKNYGKNTEPLAKAIKKHYICA
jgi:hypothetical protein